jgi:hypothetical protein
VIHLNPVPARQPLAQSEGSRPAKDFSTFRLAQEPSCIRSPSGGRNSKGTALEGTPSRLRVLPSHTVGPPRTDCKARKGGLRGALRQTASRLRPDLLRQVRLTRFLATNRLRPVSRQPAPQCFQGSSETSGTKARVVKGIGTGRTVSLRGSAPRAPASAGRNDGPPDDGPLLTQDAAG